MRSLLLLIFICVGQKATSQKIDREYLKHRYTHIPEKLIYDQIKTFGIKVNSIPSTVFTLDNTYAESSVGGFNSYEKVNFDQADMQVQVTYGPFSTVEEKTMSRATSEEINKVRTSYTLYRKVLTFRYPVSYMLTNSKNGLTLFSYDYPSSNVRTVETAEYRTELEAVNNYNQGKQNLIKNDINLLCTSVLGTCYGGTRDAFDFYPAEVNESIYQFKKWDKAEEYNEHIKSAIKIFSVMTADEKTDAYKEKLNLHFDYFKSFDGVFKPDDKAEDILYFGNNYNLAMLYYVLNDYEQAGVYIQKLEVSDKEKSAVTSLKNNIEKNIRRNAKHFITNQHLNYNPVTDYRLTDKKFLSDAISSSEKMSQSMNEGQAEANDVLVTAENKEIKGKIFVEKETGNIKFISPAEPEKLISITPTNTISFIKDNINYVTAKASVDGILGKRFFKVEFTSPKIKMLQLLNNDLSPIQDYLGLLRPTDDLVLIMLGLSVKKNLAKYFEDCPAVSTKAKDGAYGGSIYGSGKTSRVPAFITMCEEYTACK